ncbi:23S rRNA (pseudouridine(1915)-N(3))-methyltransferase RlmH [Porcipelethomonas sp.]|uniref:23S rRNA (pseudouridine(1915)-N(3))-methyltransferase RlmH n=1 Tax=Porcipelethomonas sp. TaxID=2981675 RepID=UPI003EF0FCEF
MLNVKIITVGKLKEQYLKDACAEYMKRLKRFCSAEIIELNESRLPENPSQGEIGKALETEGRDILKAASGYKIALCIEGKQLTSPGLSEKISKAAVEGQSTLSFIIGSSFGLAESVKKASDFRLSMSEMTFPHQLARVMLLEQIYRAFQIESNGKYHK